MAVLVFPWLTELLQERLGDSCPKLVRVYSDALESQVFPIPRDSLYGSCTIGRKYKLVDKESLKGVALHHLIRQDGNSKSKKIKEFDVRFAKNMKTPQNISDKEIEDYMKLTTDAAVEELPKYDIILCTCGAAAGNRITRGANIVQCIIDECGMCMEPESLVPLVKHKPEQVVLIGDHKQLAPIVMEPTAQRLGLSVSLFERYAKKAIMLDTQYRMVSELYM